MRHTYYYYLIIFIFLFFFFTCTRVTAAAGDRISINCGSSASTSLSGRGWVGDDSDDASFSIKGSSVFEAERNVPAGVDPVPYSTSRISTSPFSYTFHRLGSPGQKLIRLHFNPLINLDDFFTVEAGPFTLLSNFSPSITARALSLPTVSKEFCLITTLENQSLSVVFSPNQQQQQKHDTYAFVNGLEIISLPSSSTTLSYCHCGDIEVVGQRKSVVHLDHTTALETIHRLNVKWDSSGDDIRSMFGMWATVVKQRVDVHSNNITWKISVDVGFRYLVRLHFTRGMADEDYFVISINQMVVTILEDQGHKNYMVMMQGYKRVGKRDISVSLCSKDEHIPLEGFEIFKLSNPDNSLASPNPLPPPTRDSSPPTTNNIIVSVLGRGNAIVTVFIAVICFLNSILHMLIQSRRSQFAEALNSKTKEKRLCRHFSLYEIKSATSNFNELYVIGKGGFGKVYKGLIDDGQEIVAIKRLKSDSKQGKREFWTEIEILSELRHVNLVSLIGYCNKQKEMILVYSYMPCGTLADHLYKLAKKNNVFSSLSWKQRLSICIGAGRGLDYLHTGHGIIHRDVKSSNILLDENFIAKVSDFGLAKIESGSEFQSQASVNVKGTFGYFDPDYYRTRKLTTKSDVYSFGVVLLEVLCGRPPVDPSVEEDKRSLTMWALEKISQGEVEEIVDPILRGEVATDSLKAFVRVAERCLQDEPKKRPAIANIVIRLEFALKQQEIAESLVPNEITSVADFIPSDANLPQPERANSNGITNVAELLPLEEEENVNSVVSNEIINVSDNMECDTKTLQEKEKSSLPEEKTRSSASTRLLSMASSKVKNVAFNLKGQNYSGMLRINGKGDGSSATSKLSRILPWKAFSSKLSKKKESVQFSAPLSTRTSYTRIGEHTDYGKTTNIGGPVFNRAATRIIGATNELAVTPNLRIFSISELKVATRNFTRDTVLGEGGFGKVYKGRIVLTPNDNNGSKTNIAVKRMSIGSFQGFKEWQSEVNFLGKLSHPNLVKLLGYCWEDNELILVYEFMQKGSLEKHLFSRGGPAAVSSLSWDIRLKIITGAARGLAFLHASDRQVIHRDFKASNILLDESYNAKLSDFGLAKMGPTDDRTHVSTMVMGSTGYAAPEYVATGHLTVKSDVYGFGVILVEMLTGLRAIDSSRPSKQHNLVDWIKPYLHKLPSVMDSRLEGRYSRRSAKHIAQLALKCIAPDPKSRPSMQEIVDAMEGIVESYNIWLLGLVRSRPRTRLSPHGPWYNTSRCEVIEYSAR